jgi:hypothetical protein
MGQYDNQAMAAGKELSDVLQEAFDKDDRFADVFKEMFEAGGALKGLADTVKTAGLDKKKAILQALRGAINDLLAEDYSLDTPAEPGSQQ